MIPRLQDKNWTGRTGGEWFGSGVKGMKEEMTSEELFYKRVDNLVYAYENSKDEYIKYMWLGKLKELMLKIKRNGVKIHETRD